MKTAFFDIEHHVTCYLIGHGDTYVITELQVGRHFRGQGHARRMMEQVCAEADAHGVTLVLAVEPDHSIGSLPYGALEIFYASFGFKPIVVDGERTSAMQRQPK